MAILLLNYFKFSFLSVYKLDSLKSMDHVNWEN